MKNHYLHYTCFIALFFCSITIHGQIWDTVGNGLPGNWGHDQWGYPLPSFIESTTDGNDLYVGYTYLDTVLEVSKWDGTTWTVLPAVGLPSGSQFVLHDIQVLNGKVYLFGENSAADVCFYEYSNNSWTHKSPTNYSGHTTTSEIWGADIIIGGDFTANGGIDKIMIYDGFTYTAYPTLPIYLNIKDIQEFNNELYVSGDISQIGSWWVAQAIRKLDTASNTWVDVINKVTNNPVGLFDTILQDITMTEYNAKLHLIYTNTFGSVIEMNHDTAKFVDKLFHSVNEIAIVSNEIYFLGDSVIPAYNISKYDGTVVTNLYGSPYGTAGSAYNNELYVFSNRDTLWNGRLYNRAFKYTGGYGFINGYGYIDTDSNCTKDAGEIIVENMIVSLDTVISSTQISRYTTTNHLGKYSFGLDSGTYTIDSIYAPQNYHKNVKANCPMPAPITLATGQTVSEDLALSNNVSVDMLVNLTAVSGWRARYGFTDSYKLQASNTGNDTISTTLYVTVPDSMVFVSSTPSATSVSGKTLTFNLINMLPSENRYFTIKALVDTSLNSVGDTIVWSTYYTTITGDADLSDNSDILGLTVVASFDPNDKQVSHGSIYPNTVDRLTYHIRFQNTGNDTAYTVRIVDTLQASLAGNLVINSSSHPYALDLDSNVLSWTFNNILLPDSTTDEENSHGFINFSIDISDGLTVGDTITNFCDIYFDYNLPVRTDTAITAIVSNNISISEDIIENSIKIYPNPVNDVLFISTNEPLEYSIYDLVGRIVLKGMTNGELDVSAVKSGLYILNLITDTNTYSERILIQ